MNAGLTNLVDNGKLDQQVAKGVADLLDDEQDEVDDTNKYPKAKHQN